jgi:hypothetical protein
LLHAASHLRHSKFLSLHEDKLAKNVGRERAGRELGEACSALSGSIRVRERDPCGLYCNILVDAAVGLFQRSSSRLGNFGRYARK